MIGNIQTLDLDNGWTLEVTLPTNGNPITGTLKKDGAVVAESVIMTDTGETISVEWADKMLTEE